MTSEQTNVQIAVLAAAEITEPGHWAQDNMLVKAQSILAWMDDRDRERTQ